MSFPNNVSLLRQTNYVLRFNNVRVENIEINTDSLLRFKNRTKTVFLNSTVGLLRGELIQLIQC